MGFRNKAIFFDTFIGVFCWVGFWLKLSFRVSFMGGEFHEPIGNFDGSGSAFDNALVVASCGLAAFLIASLVRQRIIFNYPNKAKRIDSSMIYSFYNRHRFKLILLFCIAVLIIGVSNTYFGIYQRGEIPKTRLPYGLNGIYTWLLLFGLASFTALILHFEYNKKKKTTYLAAIVGLGETFISNISLLSRGMILNTGALVYGVMCSIGKNHIKTNYRFVIIISIIFVVLFLSSIFIVNNLRDSQTGIFESNSSIRILFLDRMVGIEGVMAVSSFPKKGWDLWNNALGEKFSYNSTSFYDMNIITSPYRNTDMTKHHYISLPGIIAFFFYPGSYIFLFICIFSLGIIAGLIELFVYLVGGKNLILCALLSQVIVLRYTHFGYVPSQSYLLFGALFMNVILIYSFEKFLYLKDKMTIKKSII